ncbi:hypothetical protein ACFZAM_31335 [Streptomyces sp. NPDC008079]|uniref:hypothetical protein n=1 Tax=Streptomyces sp. NPDC008079 TaxID=3364806 RepID=UPI0036E6DBEB
MGSAATYGIGWSIKQVLIREISALSGIARAVDTEGTVVEVRTGLQRTGITPRVGQTWLVDRDLGAWTFTALVATPAGPDPLHGRVVLTAGVAVVATTAVTAASNIYVMSQADGGTPGWLRISARVPGASFTVRSSSTTDLSTVAWRIHEPL